MKAKTFKNQLFTLFSSIIIVCIVPTLTFAKSSKIPVSNFKIVSFHGEWRSGTLYIIGEINNIGNIPGGPKVEVIARDSKGMLIDSAKFWPNSMDNILPGNSCGIRYHITMDSRAKTLEIKVISVDSW